MMSEKIDKLAIALSKVQGVLTGAIKDSTNPYFKSDYANLESVWESIRKPLTDNELSVCQTTDVREGVTGIVTTLLHSSGQFIQGFYPLVAVKQDPQAVGSAMTYARRYTLAAIIGQIQVDDDAESAMDRTPETTEGVTSSPIIPDDKKVCHKCGSQLITSKAGKLYCKCWYNK